MAEPEPATCPRCGAPLSADGPAGPCPRCLVADTQAEKAEIPPVSPSSPKRARRKPILLFAVAAAVLAAGLWFGLRWARQQPDGAGVLLNRGADLRREGKLDEAIAAYREAIRLKPDFAYPYDNLGTALRAQGKLDEAIAAYREAIRLDPKRDYDEALVLSRKRASSSRQRREAPTGRWRWCTGSKVTRTRPATGSTRPSRGPRRTPREHRPAPALDRSGPVAGPAGAGGRRRETALSDDRRLAERQGASPHRAGSDVICCRRELRLPTRSHDLPYIPAITQPGGKPYKATLVFAGHCGRAMAAPRS